MNGCVEIDIARGRVSVSTIECLAGQVPEVTLILCQGAESGDTVMVGESLYLETMQRDGQVLEG